VRREYIEDHYDAAWKWLELAEDYSQFCTVFPLWHRGRVEITAADGKLIVSNPLNVEKQYEAYNRLLLGEARPEEPLAPPDERLLTYLISCTSIQSDSFQVNFNPQLVARLREFLSPTAATRHTLPDSWQFTSFSLQEYRKIFFTLRSMAYGWHVARSMLAQSGMQGLGYKSSVWVVPKQELSARLKRYTRVDPPVIDRVLDLITFGSSGIRRPDIAIQPLVDLKNGSYALAPFVWLNTNMERNLCVLLNQIPAEREAYSRLTDEKELAIRDEIKEFLGTDRFDFKGGQLEGTDLDLAVIDREAKVCLGLELKWFIEPAEIREIEQRIEELAQGIVQAKKIKTLFERGDERLVKGLLGISQDYLFFTAVASMNWIGHGDVQDLDVPIIKVFHLLNHIAATGSLLDVVTWLKTRAYLPQEGKNYSIEPWEISCGKWTATWYGIKPLAQGGDSSTENDVPPGAPVAPPAVLGRG